MNKEHGYDILVVGGGGAGLTAAITAKGLGKKVAIIEKHKLGGECTWYGCVPSKALIQSAKVSYELQHLERFGLSLDQGHLDRSGVMERVRNTIAAIYEEENPEMMGKQGIDFISGEAILEDGQTIRVGETVYKAKKIILALGASPMIPAIKGLDSISYHTNETIFNVEALPESMIVVGSGAIGIEMAQSFNRLGTTVHLMLRDDRILAREDQELAGVLKQQLLDEGVLVYDHCRLDGFESHGDGLLLKYEQRGVAGALVAKEVLLATGRTFKPGKINLEQAGVAYSQRGIEVDNTLRTHNAHMYACGDAVGPYRFSHMAQYQGVIAAMNACLPVKRKVNYDNVPWVTFSQPEFAHLGLTEEQARTQYGDAIKVYRKAFRDLDRAKTDGAVVGELKVICDKKGYLLGVHILGERAGELLHEFSILRKLGKKIYELQGLIHAYPTYSDIARQVGQVALVDRLMNLPIVRNFKK